MSPRVRPALVLLAVGALLLHVGHWRHQWTDDAFITFRYARNFLAGNGMVFNPGDAVEGITNLGWALLLTPLSERDPLAAAQIVGVLCGVATVAALGAWARREGLGLAATVVTLAAFVLSPWPTFWLVQGLETPVVMLLCTLGWSRYRAEADTAGHGPVAGLALALAPWFRPDQALLAALVGAWHLHTRGAPRAGARTAVALVIVSAVALVGLKLAWYGEVLPNTFHVKVDHFPPDRGLRYLRTFFTDPSPLVPVLLLAACAWALRGAPRGDDRALPALVFVAFLFAAVLQNGDIFPNFRLLVPAWPAACAAMGLAVEAVARWAATDGPLARARRAAPVAAAVGSLLVLGTTANVGMVERLDAMGPRERTPRKDVTFWTPWRSAGWSTGPRDQMPFPTAWALVNVGPASTVAYSELGLIGFVHEGRVLDMLGLTDRVMAGRGGETLGEQAAYVTERANALVIQTNAGLWGRWRPTLAEGGWTPVASCVNSWVFQNPARPATPPDAAELQRRLSLALTRAPRAVGLHVSLARELGAAGQPRDVVVAWLDRLAAAGAVPDAELDRARCDLGLREGCASRVTCERGSERGIAAGLGGPDTWPAADPALTPPVPGAVSGPTLADARAAGGAAAPLPDGLASADGGVSRACADARNAAGGAWEDLGKRWPREPRYDDLRRGTRDAARAARAGSPQLASIVASLTTAVRGAPAELVEALDAARVEAERAATGCE